MAVRCWSIFLIAVFGSTTSVSAAPAILGYIDPGSGQLIWQMVVAGFVGALFYIKRVRLFFGKLIAKILQKKD